MEKLFGDDYKLNGSQDHALYYCPKRECQGGQEDGAPRKMYVNLDTGGFQCKKCGFAGYVSILAARRDRGPEKEVATLEEVQAELVDIGSAGWTYLTEERGLTEEELGQYDFYDAGDQSFAGGLIVPMRDEQYRGFQIRVYDRDASWRWQKMHPDLRWWNCKGFVRRNTIWNYGHVNRSLPVTVTESVFSGIACGRNSLGMLGKDVTKDQLDRLYLLGCPLVLVLDGGLKERLLSYKYAEQLWQMGRQVAIVSLPDGYDPDELRQEDPDELETLLAKPVAYSKWEHWQLARQSGQSVHGSTPPTARW